MSVECKNLVGSCPLGCGGLGFGLDWVGWCGLWLYGYGV
jgi:hypothetical protein